VHGIAPQGQTDYPRDFLDGRTAMLIDGPWRMSALEAAHEETGFNWVSAVYPQVFENPGTWGSGHSFTLPTLADEAKREAALDFVEWVVANSATWATGGQIPVFAGITETDFFKELPGRAPFVEMVDYSYILPSTPKYNEIFASNAPTPMMVLAQSIILEQAEVRPAVETACETITGILAVP
jgi:multiple sugar transport system substrate-binding protein